MKRVVVISGAIGVGKSETLRSIRETLIDVVGEIAVFESDQFYMMIDPHWTCPPDRVDRSYAVSGWLLQQTALGFLHSGFAWVAIASNGHWKNAVRGSSSDRFYSKTPASTTSRWIRERKSSVSE